MLASQAADLAQLESPAFAAWLDRMHRPRIAHRKFWEFAYIAEALFERGLLQPGRRGLGFAVGTEPLPALFAELGCEIVATDQAPSAEAGEWMASGMHALGKEQIAAGLDAAAAERLTFQHADMNAVPEALTGFDFVWSSCAIEHLGSIAHAIAFVRRAMRCLKPGGVAVHTTEFNLSSDGPTLDLCNAVLLRRQDFQLLGTLLSMNGHQLAPLSYAQADYPVDRPPFTLRVQEACYGTLPHLRLAAGGFVTTSYAVIIKAAAQPRALF